jgi:hypothetical protein
MSGPFCVLHMKERNWHCLPHKLLEFLMFAVDITTANHENPHTTPYYVPPSSTHLKENL